jgi:Fe-S-cluster-containing hydrogenase component 2
MPTQGAPEAPGTLVVRAENCRGCRSCQLACSFAKHEVFNPGKSMIAMERDLRSGQAAPMIKPLGCDLCGGEPACARACKYGAVTYQDGPSPYKLVVATKRREEG